MFFRNLTFFRFPADFAGLFPTSVANELAGLPAQLVDCALRPVGPLELSTRGFVSPFGRSGEKLSHQLGNAIWITLGGEDRLLPAAVVNELLARKLEEIEEREGRRPGGRRRKQLRDDLVHELLPKAFVQPVRVDAYFDLDRRFIAVDTTSRRTAETVVGEVRRAAGSFPALPLNAEISPRSVFTGWLAGEALPDGLSLGEEVELKDPAGSGAVVKCQHQDLASDEIARHLESGKQVTRVALVLDDHLSFVLGDDLVIRKLRFLDGAIDSLEQTEADDIAAELDARFALMAGEFGRLFDVLASALRFSEADA
ncbi:recombination-associated protein RdgC [Lysobacteraceae bacterium NML91-0213]|nr:recombination-associated protein RdgC [Xanthomonadaceae bacterium NML91-0213]